METRNANKNESTTLLEKKENHFLDFKSRDITPSKLQESFVAFANSDGGDLYVGIEDEKNYINRIKGFDKPEDANDVISVLLEQTSPAVENVDIEFIYFDSKGYVLHFSIPKSPKVHYTTQGRCFIRVNASKREIKGERVLALGYAKGSYQYEKQPVKHADILDIENSVYLKEYMERVGDHTADPMIGGPHDKPGSGSNGTEFADD